MLEHHGVRLSEPRLIPTEPKSGFAMWDVIYFSLGKSVSWKVTRLAKMLITYHLVRQYNFASIGGCSLRFLSFLWVELLELLKQRLHITEHGSSTVPGVNLAVPLKSVAFHPTLSGDSSTSVAAAVLHSVRASSSSRGRMGHTSTSCTPLHLCLSLLPLRQVIGGRSDDSQYPDRELEDTGFRFELIRSVFRRSVGS